MSEGTLARKLSIMAVALSMPLALLAGCGGSQDAGGEGSVPSQPSDAVSASDTASGTTSASSNPSTAESSTAESEASSPASSSSAGSSAPGSSAVSGDAFPVTVADKYGEVTIPKKPVRVISVGFKEQDWLYQFGVQPVAVTQWYGIYDHEITPWTADLATGKPPVVLKGELNYGQIAALKPDLIIGIYSSVTDDQYARLSKIAPTIVGSPNTPNNYNVSWQEMTHTIGKALGQSAKADQIVTNIEERIENAKNEHPEFVGKKVIASYAWSESSIGAYTSDDPRSKLLTGLGMVVPEKLDAMAEKGRFNVPLSPELVGEVFDMADVDVVIGAPSGDEAPGADATLKNTTFTASRVASEGRVVFLDTTITDVAFSFLSPLAIEFSLDYLVPAMAAAVDGDPATKVPPAPTSF